MMYYKYLDLDISASSKFLRSYYNEHKEKFTCFWNKLDIYPIMSECPELQQSFDPLGVRIKRLAFIVSTSTSVIHKDYCNARVRINIPVQDCEYAHTRFFTTEIEPTIQRSPNGNPYYHYNRRDCTLADTCQIVDKATAIDVHKLHQVFLTKPGVVRVTCSIAFHENIEHLLPE